MRLADNIESKVPGMLKNLVGKPEEKKFTYKSKNR
jgi:hypothetical protein